MVAEKGLLLQASAFHLRLMPMQLAAYIVRYIFMHKLCTQSRIIFRSEVCFSVFVAAR